MYNTVNFKTEDPRHVFVATTPVFGEMIAYATGVSLPVVRPACLYTDASYWQLLRSLLTPQPDHPSSTNGHEVGGHHPMYTNLCTSGLVYDWRGGARPPFGVSAGIYVQKSFV